MNEVVILTPTFNRVNLLKRLYLSLENQSDLRFTWLIIDDGSNDETRESIKKIIGNSNLDIRYFYQTNKGKASALNLGFKHAKNAMMVAIVDSDDLLNSNAIETFISYVDQYRYDGTIGGMFFHYIDSSSGNVIKPKNGKIDSDVSLTRYDYDRIYGKHDGCICYMNSVFNNFRYPVIPGEKYMGPTVLQLIMSEKYKILFSPKVVGVAEYQLGGITHSGRKLRLSSPKSMMIYCELMMNKKSPVKTRYKYAVSMWPYALEDKKSIRKILQDTNNPIKLLFTYIPGKLLYLKWKKQI